MSAASETASEGELFLYDENFGYAGFEAGGRGEGPKALVFIGGLTDGLLSLRYLPYLAEALRPRGWRSFQPVLQSSYRGWGFNSLDEDVAGLDKFLDFLASKRGISKVVLLGSSTGCQDAVHYLKRGQRKSLIHGIILQAPVSDREALLAEERSPEDLEALAHFKDLAKQLISEGHGDELLPRRACALFGPPDAITAYRFDSLTRRMGDDDLFSSDLLEEELVEKLGHVTVPCLLALSADDEYVPSFVDSAALGRRMADAMAVGPGGGAKVVVLGSGGHGVRTAEGQAQFMLSVAEFLSELDQGHLFPLEWETALAGQLLDRARAFSEREQRPFLVALAGMPGCGKTVTAEILKRLLHPRCLVVPMDGFHIPLSELKSRVDADDAIYRRGAADTFDPKALKEKLLEIRSGPDQVLLPDFDHAHGDPTFDTICFERSRHQIVLVEGLYLLHQRDGWKGMDQLFDFTIYIDADLEESDLSEGCLRSETRSFQATRRKRLIDAVKKWIEQMPRWCKHRRAKLNSPQSDHGLHNLGQHRPAEAAQLALLACRIVAMRKRGKKTEEGAVTAAQAASAASGLKARGGACWRWCGVIFGLIILGAPDEAFTRAAVPLVRQFVTARYKDYGKGKVTLRHLKNHIVAKSDLGLTNRPKNIWQPTRPALMQTPGQMEEDEPCDPAAVEARAEEVQRLRDALGSDVHPQLGLPWLRYGSALLRMTERGIAGEEQKARSAEASLQDRLIWAFGLLGTACGGEESCARASYEELEEDLEVAWETLETARQRLQADKEPSSSSLLAQCHLRLVDLLVLQGHKGLAVEECKKAVECCQTDQEKASAQSRLADVEFMAKLRDVVNENETGEEADPNFTPGPSTIPEVPVRKRPRSNATGAATGATAPEEIAARDDEGYANLAPPYVAHSVLPAADLDPVTAETAVAATGGVSGVKTERYLVDEVRSEAEKSSDGDGEPSDVDVISEDSKSEDPMDEEYFIMSHRSSYSLGLGNQSAHQDEILRLAGVEDESWERGPAAEERGPDTVEGGELPLDRRKAFEVDDSVPTPQTGISIPLGATPRFLRVVPEQPELLYTAPETLFDEICKAEAERMSQPEGIRNRIVYDSVGDPFKTEPAPCRFESGNLRRAVQAYEFEYDLILNPDYNTKSHTQWYFFRVGNTRKGPQYRFNIINMVKPTSVYNEGMRPLQYSCIQAASKGIGWVRCGDRIAYYQNGLRKQKGSNYYTLTFTVTFDHDCDEVYFSHCYPYTFSDLQVDLKALERDPHMVRRLRRRKLCDTLAGNACDLITITSFCSDPAQLKARRAVVITARVHPGESNASWVMKGILDYLTGSSVDARILRDNFVFKIVPMLNPDGVIVGNYRCSLAGQDLNRLWDEPSRKMHPTIFFTKSMFRHLLDDREVILFVDIHGHSRKKNVFMYGNSENNGLKQKIFPGLLCRSSDCFSFDDCCFKIQKSKESTARVVAYRELGVVNSYTLEASFCGADFGPLGEQHFTTRHLEEMGYMVCDAILDFCDPDQSKVMLVSKELQVLFPDDGNSDDVSDSEDDGAAALRRKTRQARKAGKQKEKPPSRKKKTGKAKEEDRRADEAKKSSAKSPKTQEVEVSPLEVNFSQHVIYPLFSDGTSVDETVREVTAEIYWLKAPFPPIQAVRWCPKLRDGEGKPVLDENGEERRGVEGLFTLDNRRLYVLQRAAVYQYPRSEQSGREMRSAADVESRLRALPPDIWQRKCKITVEVVTDRWEVLNHLKKFRTRTNGLSIFVSEWNGTGRDNTKHFDVLRVWDWRSAVSKLEEGPAEQEQAADAGNCGCWEYLDPRKLCRGPYSNWQMQQWWDHGMLPRDLQIRPFRPKTGDAGEEGGFQAEFRPVLEVFADAPKPFDPGWSPTLALKDDVFYRCAQCRRQRLDGWSARGQWYCSNCWRRWDTNA
eukprot:g23429.t1